MIKTMKGRDISPEEAEDSGGVPKDMLVGEGAVDEAFIDFCLSDVFVKKISGGESV